MRRKILVRTVERVRKPSTTILATLLCLLIAVQAVRPGIVPDQILSMVIAGLVIFISLILRRFKVSRPPAEAIWVGLLLVAYWLSLPKSTDPSAVVNFMAVVAVGFAIPLLLPNALLPLVYWITLVVVPAVATLASGLQEALLTGSRFLGTAANPNAWAMWYLAALPIGLSLIHQRRTPAWSKALAVAALPVNLLGLIATGSRSAILSIALSILLLLWRLGQATRALVIFISISLLLPVFLPEVAERFGTRVGSLGSVTEDPGEAVRLDLLRAAVAVIADHPSGVGYGHVRDYMVVYGAPVRLASHNAPLGLGMEAGLPALIAWIGLFCTEFTLWWQLEGSYKRRDDLWSTYIGSWAAVIAMWCHNLFHISVHSLLLWLMVGTVAVLGRQLKSKSEVRTQRCGHS